MQTDDQLPGAAPVAKSERLTIAAVIAAVLVGTFQAVIASSNMLDLSRQQATASQIVQRRLENLQAGDLIQMQDAALSAKGGDSEPQSERDHPGFIVRRTITAIGTDMKQVTLTVSWQGSSGRTYSQTGSVLVAKDGRFVANE
ncbi:MAG: hypothetical protein ABIR80_00110 [Opitutaceae bacterium]